MNSSEGHIVSGAEKQETPEDFYEFMRGSGMDVEGAIEATQRWYPGWVREVHKSVTSSPELEGVTK